MSAPAQTRPYFRLRRELEIAIENVRELEPLMQSISSKIRYVQAQGSATVQGAGSSQRILKHLIAQAADNMGNDHVQSSIPSCRLLVIGLFTRHPGFASPKPRDRL